MRPPGRELWPLIHCLCRPCRRFSLMTRCAGIRNLIFVGHRRRNETKCVSVNHGIWWAFCFNCRHVARDALTSGTAVLVMRVFLDRRCSWAVRRGGSVTIKTELISGLTQLRVIRRAVNVVAIETRDAATIHYTLHKIVSLHPVLVCRAVREIKKILRFSKSVVFQLPIILEVNSHVIPNRPVVIFSFDWV